MAQVRDYAIIRLDTDGVIESWNLGAERVKGYTAEEAIGRSFTMFYTEEDRALGLPQTLLAAARDEGRVEHTGWRVRSDGTRFWADVVITALHDEHGRHVGFTKVTRDLTEQHELETRLRASEERLRLLVGQVQDYAIIALDPEGTIQTWNLGAERVKGYTAEEAIGRSFAMFYPEEDRRAGLPQRLLARARDHGRVEHTGWRVRQDGTRFWGDAVITALYDDERRLTGYAKVTRDRTDLKRLEEAQDAFYAAFTHDFSTPVAAMMGYLDVLRGATDDEREHLIDRVEANAVRLREMVNGLVEFATTRAAHASLVIDPVDVVAIAIEAVRDLPLALAGDRVRVSGEPGTVARANDVGLQRVVTNLVVNALKYSPVDTEVEVTVDRTPGAVRLRVVDRGRGIAPEDLPTIFDEFVRGRLAEDDGGSGLGLASVRELVGQMGGEVAIESTLGEGTTVLVNLPAAGGPQASAAPTVVAGQPAG